MPAPDRPVAHRRRVRRSGAAVVVGATTAAVTGLSLAWAAQGTGIPASTTRADPAVARQIARDEDAVAQLQSHIASINDQINRYSSETTTPTTTPPAAAPAPAAAAAAAPAPVAAAPAPVAAAAPTPAPATTVPPAPKPPPAPPVTVPPAPKPPPTQATTGASSAP